MVSKKDELTQPADVAASTPEAKPAAPGGISTRLIENVGVELDAFLGAVKMTVGELSRLDAGNVVALDAPLNALVELKLNGIAVARGELVAVGAKFGVRLTEISQWPD